MTDATDINLDRTRFRIVSRSGRVSIDFRPDDGEFCEPDAGCDRRHVFRRITVDWDPNVAEAVARLDALSIPSSSLDATVDDYIGIIDKAFGSQCAILAMSDDERLVKQCWLSDHRAIRARFDRTF